MRSGVIAQKMGMTRVFTDGGEHVPVTVLRLANCQVIAHRTKDKNGYVALQLGSGTRKPKNLTKAERGHFAVAKVEPKRKLAEFRVEESGLIPVGAEITADHFVVGPVRRRDRHLDRQGLRRRHEALEFRRTARLARRVGLASIDRLDRRSPGPRQDLQEQENARPYGRRRASPRSISRWCRPTSSAASSWSRARCPGAKGGWITLRDAVKKKLPKDAADARQIPAAGDGRRRAAGRDGRGVTCN